MVAELMTSKQKRIRLTSDAETASFTAGDLPGDVVDEAPGGRGWARCRGHTDFRAVSLQEARAKVFQDPAQTQVLSSCASKYVLK